MFIRDVSQLGLANVAAQVVSFLVVPLLTRLYSPLDYGAFAIYLAVLNTLIPIASLRFHAALALPRKTEDRRAVFMIALGMVGLGTGFIFLLVFSVHYWELMPAEWVSSGIISLLWLLPLNLAVMGTAQLLTAWLMAHNDFRSTAVARVAESFFDRAVSCLCALSSITQHMGLVWGRLLGSAATASILWRSAHRSHKRDLWASFSLSQLVHTMNRYRHFALVSSCATMCDGAARQAPALLLAFSFSPMIAGYYALAFQVTNVPLLIAGDALASTFYQRAILSRENPAKLANDTIRLFRAMLGMIIPLTLALWFLGKPLFRLVFGLPWEEAGDYAEVLAIGFLFMFLHRPLSVLFDVFEAQTVRLWLDILNLVLRIATIIGFAHWFPDPKIVLIGFTIVSAGSYGGGLLYLLRMAGVTVHQSLSLFSRQTIIFVPLGLALWLVAPMGIDSQPHFGLAITALAVQALFIFRYEKETVSLLSGLTSLTNRTP
ncbi:MAG: oligosaccharide flippase family protein [Nitrospira sp.]|nr:oligosaccharide flippase family protein [Nitrospira sp.]